MSYGADREFRSIRLAIFRECLIFAHLKPTFHFEMKKFLLVVAAAAFMVALPSCKKCVTCTVTLGGISSVSPEVCGKKSEIDAAEKNCNTSAQTVGGTCNCSKD